MVLKELNLYNFNTNKVMDMRCMFSGCLLLKDLNISNFKVNFFTNTCNIFDHCPNELPKKIPQ